MDFIFNKDDVRKLELFSYLENTYGQSATIKELKEHFSWSTFITTTTIEALEEDILHEGLDHYYILTFNEKKVFLQKNGLDSIDHLVLFYAENSPQYQMLNSMFKTDDFNLDSFTYSLFFSEATGYRTKKLLDDTLSEIGFSLTSNFHLDAPEEKIRMLFYRLYLSIYKNYSFPFEEDIDCYSSILCTQIIERLNLKPTHVQVLKLKYFSAITLQSLELNHFIMDSENNSYIDKTDMENTISVIESCLSENPGASNLTEEQLEYEVSFILNFLYMEGFIKANLAESELSKKIEVMNNLVIEDVQKFFNISLSTEQCDTLFKGLTRIHFSNAYNIPIAFSWHNNFDNSILKENYSWFYLFVDQFLKKTIEKDEHNSDDILFLKAKYIFLLVRYLDTPKIIKPVRVTIDFSQGQDYNELIHKNLKALPFFNLEVNFILSEDTDIYLSDFLMADTPGRYLIWSNPPLASDWEIFANMLVDLRTNAGGTPVDQ